MTTADSLLNIESRYDSLYQKLGHLSQSKLSPSPERSPGMAYRYMTSKQLSPSAIYGRPFDDVEEMDIDRNLLIAEGRNALTCFDVTTAFFYLFAIQKYYAHFCLTPVDPSPHNLDFTNIFFYW